MQKLLVRRISTSVPLPRYAHDFDAGIDICSAERNLLRVRERKLIRTGIELEMPRLMEAQIRSRSGLAVNHGVIVLNSPGTIDSGYRGEVLVVLINHGEKDFQIEIGMKIAQLVISRVTRVKIQEATKLSPSSRGTAGFGSTG
jgi:dUTP pyrophosphatase